MFETSAIRAVIFDLDGTLVETEHLKAQAYAELVGNLTGRDAPQPEAIELYRSIVGATDLAVCDAMIARFDLVPVLETLEDDTPREALHRHRMAIYQNTYGTAANLRRLAYPHNVELARAASSEGLPVGVATMSFASEARRVIEVIGLSETVQTIVGVDDVVNPKPAPDAFLLAMERLAAKPTETLVVEDSPRGTRAAAASGARWLCVATEFSKEALRADSELDPQWIVWDPSGLSDAVARRISGQGC